MASSGSDYAPRVALARTVLVWSGTSPRQLLGLFPGRIVQRRYGLLLPVLVGWTHPYAPLGTPLVAREAAEPVISAWLAHLTGNSALPALLMLSLMTEDGPFAAALNAILDRARMPFAARHRRALLEPRDLRAHYVEHRRRLSRRRFAIHRGGGVEACRRRQGRDQPHRHRRARHRCRDHTAQRRRRLVLENRL